MAGVVRLPPFFMGYLILGLIAVVNLIPLVMNDLVIWKAQGVGVRACILATFCLSLYLPKKYKDKNLPIAWLIGWIGFVTLWVYCLQGKGSIFTAFHISSFFNVICFVVLYKAIVEYCRDRELWNIFVWLRYSIIFTMILCVSQKFDSSQFFSLFIKNNQFIDNLVTGVIGNGTHLSGFLAMCAPLFFTKKREDVLALTLLFILLFFCGQSRSDISISGFFIFAVLVGVFLFRSCRKLFYIMCGIGTAILVTFLIFCDEKTVNTFFAFNGRLETWKMYLPIIKQHFYTGIGLGSVLALGAKGIPHFLHNEYLQILTEVGFVGLMLVIWNIKDFFKIHAGGARLRYQLIFLGFLLSGLFNYPMHLWLPATYACIAYAGVVALRREEC